MSVIELLIGIVLFIIIAIIAYMVYKSVRSNTGTSVFDSLKNDMKLKPSKNKFQPPSTLPITAQPPPSTLPITAQPPPTTGPLLPATHDDGGGGDGSGGDQLSPNEHINNEITSGNYDTDPITNLPTTEPPQDGDNFSLKKAKFYELNDIAVPEVDDEDDVIGSSQSLNDEHRKGFGLGKFLRKRGIKPKSKGKDIR